ncbi:MAG: class I SAM-dependent methyltransferase [Cyanobacteria bacterium P01_C01_bin.89]
MEGSKTFSWRVAITWLLGLLICGGLIWGGPLAKPAIALSVAVNSNVEHPEAVDLEAADPEATDPEAADLEATDLEAIDLETENSVYSYRDRPSSDGIGKVYLGREIAKVMGYEGAGWLERGGRESQEKPSAAIASLNLRPDDVVVDIGAGTGYFSTRIVPKVPEGQVLAVDVQPEMVDILGWMKNEYQLSNLQPVLGNETDPHLPEGGVDVVIMVDVYHELAYPNEMMRKVVRALRPDGRVVVLEYRAENPFVLIKRLHKMSLRQLQKEMQTVGLKLAESPKILPKQHYAIFTLDKDAVEG